MKHISEILKSIDPKKVAEEFAESLRKEEEAKLKFWNSPLCETMIQDILKADESFSEESFLFFPEKIKAQYGWEHIGHKDIQQFINVMADSKIGVPDDYQPEVDTENMFDNLSFVKKGINVFVMYGQGRAVVLSPN